MAQAHSAHDDDLMKPDFSASHKSDVKTAPSGPDDLMKPETAKPAGKANGPDMMDGMPMNYYVLEAGDSELLAKLVQQNPQMEQQILTRAAKDLGQETVNKACEILHPKIAPAKTTKPADSNANSNLLDGLPTEYYVLEAGDSALLAKLVQKYPQMQRQILTRAVTDLGQETVDKAQQILNGEKPEAAKQEEPKTTKKVSLNDVLPLVLILEPGDQEHLATLVRNHPEMRDEILDEARKYVDEETVKKAVEILNGKAGGTKEPQWVTHARAYNKRDPQLIQFFNDATGYSTTLDDSTEPDPRLVSQWQAKHGLQPDGRVGEKTTKKALDLSVADKKRERIADIAKDLE